MDYEHVEDGLNCYVDLTTACNARCPFCIAETVGRQSGPGLMDGLTWALGFTQTHNGTVQVVGGEPTISRRLVSVLHEIQRYSFRRVVLNTNGTFDRDYPSMARAGVTHLDISRHHWDDAVNQSVMRMKPPLSTTDLALRIRHAARLGMSVRVQAVLLRGVVDDFDSVRKFSDYAIALGAGAVAVSEPFPLHLLDHQVEPEPGFTAAAGVEVGALVGALDASPEFGGARPEFMPDGSSPWGGKQWFWWGPEGTASLGHRRHWTYRGVPFSVKTFAGFDRYGSPLKPTYDRQADPELQPGHVSFLVVQADGTVTASWDRRERVLWRPTTKMASVISAAVCNPKGAP